MDENEDNLSHSYKNGTSVQCNNDDTNRMKDKLSLNIIDEDQLNMKEIEKKLKQWAKLMIDQDNAYYGINMRW